MSDSAFLLFGVRPHTINRVEDVLYIMHYAFCICHLLFGETGGISYADENSPLRNQTRLHSTPPLVCALCCPNDRQRGGVCYPWYGNLPKQRKPKEIITKNDIIKMQWTVWLPFVYVWFVLGNAYDVLHETWCVAYVGKHKGRYELLPKSSWWQYLAFQLWLWQWWSTAFHLRLPRWITTLHWHKMCPALQWHKQRWLFPVPKKWEWYRNKHL